MELIKYFTESYELAFVGFLALCAVCTLIYAAARLIFNSIYGLIEKITPPQVEKTEYHSETRKMYVLAGTNEKKYKCAADIIINKQNLFVSTILTSRLHSSEIISYEIERFYWTSGGSISFAPGDCRLELNVEKQLISSNGKIYNVTLTNEIVENTIAEVNEIKLFKKKVETYLKRLINISVKDFPQFVGIISDLNNAVENTLNKELSKHIIDDFKYKSIITLREEYTQSLKDIEKKYKVYQYQLDILKNVFPEIRNFDLSQSENYIPCGESIHPENILGYIESYVPELQKTNVELEKENQRLKEENIYYYEINKELTSDYKNELKKLEKTKNSLKKHEKKLTEYQKAFSAFMNEVSQKSEIDLSYYSTLISDYTKMINDKVEKSLRKKIRPAIRSADKVREISSQLHSTEKKYRLISYQMELYEKLFPWITEYREVSFDDIKEITQNNSVDTQTEKQYLREYLSPVEYDKLSNAEKYQLALDRYKKRKKSNWQIGITYERYIGYVYESKGYKVEYHGAKKGLEDLGRDLIAKKGNKVLIIQCKYWNKEKIIHEKHIFQLYGTMFAYSLKHENKNYDVKGMFITSATLSDLAKTYAERLNICCKELVNFDKEYPCIKCNIGKEGKIYHLPFDQQYDNVVIDYKKGECYAQTVADAEALGFRRANKWTGSNQ